MSQEGKTLVVKVGSALLVDATGNLRADWLDALAQDVRQLKQAGWQLVLVSSGAIRLGLGQLGRRRDARLGYDQAAAAVGQIGLAEAYRATFAKHSLSVAQVLLTLEDSESRRRYLNARTTLSCLLEWEQVPVVNENDTVATEEIRFGDNDRLAARVATMVSADELVLLSDVDGLYTREPSEPGAEHLPHVEAVTAEIEAMAGLHKGELSHGGMVTKLNAAKIATQAGCAMRIGDGREAGALGALMRNEKRQTRFHAQATPRSARAAWIQGSLKPAGTLVLDAGAATAVRAHKSLLPAGVLQSHGAYARGDTLVMEDLSGVEIGRGLSAYDAAETERLLGQQSGDIQSLLGYTRGKALIHADDLVLSGEKAP